MESKRSLDDYQLPPGKTAVVVGATTGIGAAVARKLSSVGCSRVIILGRNEERGMEVINRMKQLSKEKVQADFVKGDISYVRGIKDAFDSIKSALSDVQVDYIVMCQNGPPTGTINLNEDGEGTGFTIQVISRFLLAYLFASHALISQGGKVMLFTNPGLSYDGLDIDDLSLKKVAENGRSRVLLTVDQSKRDSTVLDSVTLVSHLSLWDSMLQKVHYSYSTNDSLNISSTMFIQPHIPVQMLASADLGQGKFWDLKLKPKSPGKWASDRGNREKLWDKLLTMTGSR
ncbi:hypothetical protein I204_06935 [Kwoniella mangroviensis CBS 8886]|nr:uncharacterized protein I203_01093 [Kwoniella mangroviensis CBS 8507]OCF69239.1 hypothetical protein I203_01093 [Kwoniella mangroviensis CBS 8507]OCF72553.1 hypothetical protein I204_06935 [Kwoniella mangroviensis CBS 8886]